MPKARLSPPCNSAAHDASSESAAIELLRLKRKLAATRQELDQARDGRPKKIPWVWLISFRFTAIRIIPFYYRTVVTMGRGIRRLVSLFESLELIINEANNRLQAEADEDVP